VTATAEQATVEFDHHSEAYASDPVGLFRTLRDQCPVAHTEAHGGFWVVTRYEDIAAAAADDATFSSLHVPGDATWKGITIPEANIRAIPIELDPPDFLAYRRVLNPLFSPAAVERWRPTIERWASACIDQVIETGVFDVVLDLTNPVPALFTCEFLGLPVEDWERYARTAHESVYAVPGTPEHARAREGGRWTVEQLAELVARRRREPQDDLMTVLTQAKVNGEPLPDRDVTDICLLVIAGGFDTTTAVASHAVRYLSHNPIAAEQLRADPAAMAPAIEEFLRYFTPQQALARTVTRDTELGGQKLKAGDRVLLVWASANHDPEMFDEPDELLLDRFPNRHTAFGLGIHRCLGSNFARAEIAAMLDEVLRRMPDLTVIDSEAVRYPTIGTVNGWVKMPATFTPGPRLSEARLPGPR
jgi:cytochrome P450